MESLFDLDGRFINSDEAIGYQKSRKYFCLDHEIKQKITTKRIYENSIKFFNEKISISENLFNDKLEIINKEINKNESIKNIKNCINIPFILIILIVLEDACLLTAFIHLSPPCLFNYFEYI